MTQIEPKGVFFWARSGGGHRTAKEGIKQQKIKEYRAQGKTLDTKTDIDITGEKVLSSVRLPFVGGLGDIGVNAWDNAQRRGDLSFLQRYASWGWLGELILYPLVYFRVKWLLQDLKVEPEIVVSTQAFCINAIVRAMHTVNKQKKWNMHMHVHLTDMPSKKAIHFFPSIKKAARSETLRNMITLHAAPPITKEGESEKDFWEKYCGKIKVITNESYPIRQDFLDTRELKEKLEKETVEVAIKLNRPNEAAIIKKGLQNEAAFDDEKISIKLKQEDKLGFLMLGSQPTTEAVLEWLRTFSHESQTQDKNLQHYFFLYCGHPESELLDAVSKELDTLQLAPNFNVVPFTDQDADAIALLMARSDVSITRSGGATTMELLELDRADLPKREDKQVLIHSEAMFEKQSTQPPKEFVESIRADIAKHMDKKRLVSEYGDIKKQMVAYCKSHGFTTHQAQAVSENILGLYVYNDEPPQLEKLFQELTEVATKFSKPPKEIEEQMKKMQKKAKYQEVTLAALRELAIERVLIKQGIVLWEGGNAKYLSKKIGAHVTNPHYAKKLLARSFF